MKKIDQYYEATGFLRENMKLKVRTSFDKYSTAAKKGKAHFEEVLNAVYEIDASTKYRKVGLGLFSNLADANKARLLHKMNESLNQLIAIFSKLSILGEGLIIDSRNLSLSIFDPKFCSVDTSGSSQKVCTIVEESNFERYSLTFRE
eukprot:TRINITY_DN2661_c0_g1_i5.p1 TRINITY_DN2661_c0_g1~~TRINITY_DN2661_c0_g1_i5.p1  ORF type:complete len:147 (-),score=17.78 TRINITY_DN2661_c0_g1_i5:275-715(-)